MKNKKIDNNKKENTTTEQDNKRKYIIILIFILILLNLKFVFYQMNDELHYVLDLLLYLIC